MTCPAGGERGCNSAEHFSVSKWAGGENIRRGPWRREGTRAVAQAGGRERAASVPSVASSSRAGAVMVARAALGRWKLDLFQRSTETATGPRNPKPMAA